MTVPPEEEEYALRMHEYGWAALPLACLEFRRGNASSEDNATSMDTVSTYVNETKF